MYPLLVLVTAPKGPGLKQEESLRLKDQNGSGAIKWKSKVTCVFHFPYCWSVHGALWATVNKRGGYGISESQPTLSSPPSSPLLPPRSSLKNEWQSRARIFIEPKCQWLQFSLEGTKRLKGSPWGLLLWNLLAEICRGKRWKEMRKPDILQSFIKQSRS